MQNTKGRLISIEGIDGAGKSTHLPHIIRTLAHHSVQVVQTREPGGTPLGEKLREILLHDTMDPDTEALLMFASRNELIKKVIVPALDNGCWVLTDRFTDSSFAYQSGGRGIPRERLEQLETLVCRGLEPDLTFLFDVPLHIAQDRMKKSGAIFDKFEREQAQFFAATRVEYLRRSMERPSVVIIDASKTLAEITSDITYHLLRFLCQIGKISIPLPTNAPAPYIPEV